MLRPSYAELMETMSKNSENDVQSRYTVVIAAAKRARQLIDGDDAMTDEDVNVEKPVSIAVEEIREGKISVVPEGQGTIVKKNVKNENSDYTSDEIKKELEQQKANANDSKEFESNGFVVGEMEEDEAENNDSIADSVNSLLDAIVGEE